MLFFSVEIFIFLIFALDYTYFCFFFLFGLFVLFCVRWMLGFYVNWYVMGMKEFLENTSKRPRMSHASGK